MVESKMYASCVSVCRGWGSVEGRKHGFPSASEGARRKKNEAGIRKEDTRKHRGMNER